MTNENFGYLAPSIEADNATKIIKKRLVELELSIEELAQEFGCKRNQLSMTIHQHYGRVYPELRRKLSLRLGIPYERLWGKPNSPYRRTGKYSARQAA